ncbi:MAG TPA: lipid A deacylase LpxR family protein [Bacteroidia bacterium]|nr:lipid A deacylase LpxR family protein [Bacteroidia bacterium]
MLRRLVISFFLFPLFLSAQEQDTTPLLKSLKLIYENDLFTNTDYYYTGGTFVEFDLPCLRKDPLSKALVKLPHGRNESYGISINNLGFSPRSIKSDSILLGDRPFSATLYLGLNRVSCNTQKKIRLNSELDLGVIGPSALGYQEQKFIHTHTNNPIPHGWEFQIRNDVYINYSVRLEKGLVAVKRFFDFTGYGFANAGTIYNNAGIGLTTRIGRMNNYFQAPGFSKRFQCWIFARGEGKLVAHDATLEGGFFNTRSIYVIPPENIKHSTFSFSAGIVFAYKKIHLEFYDTALTPEFKDCWPHAWGHIGLEILL